MKLFQKNINEDLQNFELFKRKYWEKIWERSILMCLILWILYTIGILLSWSYSDIIFSISFPWIVSFCFILVIFWYSILPLAYKISDNLQNLAEWNVHTNTIEIVLNKIEILWKQVWLLHNLKWISILYFLYQEYIQWISWVINYITKLLLKLRSDLQIRLDEQQKVLESAKSEVEKNIHWTTELDYVSELQKARLDRQIEQFEELQRVLVKV